MLKNTVAILKFWNRSIYQQLASTRSCSPSLWISSLHSEAITNEKWLWKFATLPINQIWTLYRSTEGVSCLFKYLLAHSHLKSLNNFNLQIQHHSQNLITQKVPFKLIKDNITERNRSWLRRKRLFHFEPLPYKVNKHDQNTHFA